MPHLSPLSPPSHLVQLDDDGDDAQGPGLFPHEPQPLPELPEEVWMKVLHQVGGCRAHLFAPCAGVVLMGWASGP